MNDTIWTQLTDTTQKALEPLTRLNEMMAAGLQKVAEFQMDALKTYADLATRQMTAAMEIRDAESLGQFLQQQTEVAGEISRKFLEDLRTLGEMGAEFREEVEKLFEQARQTTGQSDKQAA